MKTLLFTILFALTAAAQDAPVSTLPQSFPLSPDLFYLVKSAGGGVYQSRAATMAGLDDNVRHATRYPGGDAGAKITAAIADLPSTGGTVDASGLEGAQTISSNLTIGATGKPILLKLNPGSTYTLAAATIILASGSAIDGGGGSCFTVGSCATLRRTTGTSSMITATGTAVAHVQGFALRNLLLDGGGTAGHGLVFSYVNSFTLDNVHVSNGGASSALQLLNEAWDFTVMNSHFVQWGNTSNYIVDLVGASGTSQITDGHWVAVQLGEYNTSAPILRANAFVLQQRFVDVKFHPTGASMTHAVDWSGYRTDFIGCSFQGDQAAATGGLVRIKNADNHIIGGVFNDINTGDGIHVVGPSAGLILTNIKIAGAGSPSPGAAVVTEATASGNVIVGNNEIGNLAIGYNFITSSAKFSVGATIFSSVTTPINMAAGNAWEDWNNGRGTVTIGGQNPPTARDGVTYNAPLHVGGSVATNSAGYQSSFFQTKFLGSGQLNETLGIGSGALSGIGNVDGTNIQHPIGWCYVGDPVCFELFTKTAGTAISGNSAMRIYADGSIQPNRASTLFSSLQACSAANAGRIYYVSDSTTSSDGSTITGGGANKVLAVCDGTNWVKH